MKNLIKASVYGLAIGSLVELLVSVIVSVLNGTTVFVWATPSYLATFGENTLLAVFIAKAVYMLIGVLSLAAARIFDSERLSLTSATVGHFALTLAIIGIAGLGLKWFPVTASGVAIFLAIFVVVYAIVWVVNYVGISRNVKDMNAKLQVANG